jgi:predicted amidophosphoribosyltransferase
LVAVPYCRRCSRKIEPYQERCPKCGSLVRFRFVEKGKEQPPEQEEETGFIRPPWKTKAA